MPSPTPNRTATMDPITIGAICLIIGALGGGAGGAAIGASKANARAEKARAAALETAATAGTEAATVVLADERERTGALVDDLSRMASPYCDAESEAYNETACLTDRLCTRSGITEDGGDATACERMVNLYLTEREIAVVEGGDAPEPLREERRGVFTRRK